MRNRIYKTRENTLQGAEDHLTQSWTQNIHLYKNSTYFITQNILKSRLNQYTRFNPKIKRLQIS